ncbi:MAG: threonine dehydratase [Rivularia sp. ALOHA_DT_140]|nr:threonine dehydratase [Rivularia sp. ALOHA_DT_140]
MSRIVQIVQNSFIRAIAIFSVVFRSIFGFLGNIFGGFGQSLGFSNSSSGYFIDSDDRKALEESQTSFVSTNTPEPSISSNRRRPNKSNMDDFMKMAQELNNG